MVIQGTKSICSLSLIKVGFIHDRDFLIFLWHDPYVFGKLRIWNDERLNVSLCVVYNVKFHLHLFLSCLSLSTILSSKLDNVRKVDEGQTRHLACCGRQCVPEGGLPHQDDWSLSGYY